MLTGYEAKIEARGEAEGKAEERMSSIRNLVDNLNLTVVQAMEALGIPKNERSDLQKQL